MSDDLGEEFNIRARTVYAILKECGEPMSLGEIGKEYARYLSLSPTLAVSTEDLGKHYAQSGLKCLRNFGIVAHDKESRTWRLVE